TRDLVRAVLLASGLRPAIVALDADPDPAGKLIVATGRGAADEAMLIVLAERLAEEIAAGRAHDPVFLRGPQTARMAAEIAAAPAPNRGGRRRRLIDGKPHVGRARRARQRNQRGRCEQEFPHHLAPAMREGRSMQRVGAERCNRSATHQRGFARKATEALARPRCLPCPLPSRPRTLSDFAPSMMPSAGKTRVGTAR